MNVRWRRTAGLALWTALAFAGAGGVGARFVRARLEERAANARVSAARATWERLRAQRPAPVASVAAELARTLADMEEEVAARRRRVVAPDAERGAPPAREGAFFDLAWFGDAMLASAGAADVAVRPGERFGFAAYSDRAPTMDEVGPVLQQSWLVERLLEALFAAGPERLEGVWREPQAAPVGPGGGGRVAAPDEFLLESRLSLRRHPGVRTQAIRVAFVGATPCLRRFLNGLLGQEIPWFVRSVELEALPGPVGASALPGAAGTRFTVVVEAVEAVNALGKESES
jgi:hypothetical protein